MPLESDSLIMVDFLRGNEIVFVNGVWRFTDTMERTTSTWKHRPCGLCGQQATAEGHDACIGTLPSVMNACCGHGELQKAYVQFNDGIRIGGQAAIVFFKMVAEDLN